MAITQVEAAPVDVSEVPPNDIENSPEANGKRRGRPAADKADKIKYPVPEGGLSEFPKDWRSSKHLPLNREDFTTPIPFLQYRRKKQEQALASTVAELDAFEKYGGNPEAVKLQKKTEALTSKLSEVLASLTAMQADGVEIDKSKMVQELLERAGLK